MRAARIALPIATPSFSKEENSNFTLLAGISSVFLKKIFLHCPKCLSTVQQDHLQLQQLPDLEDLLRFDKP